MRFKVLAAAAALVMMLTGCGAAAEAVKVPKPLPVLTGLTVSAPQTPLVPCREDQPCWDCLTMGNHLCGPTAAGQAEAWDAFKAETVAKLDLSKPFKVTYLGTVAHGLSAKFYTLPSSRPGIDHAFKIEMGETK